MLTKLMIWLFDVDFLGKFLMPTIYIGKLIWILKKMIREILEK